MHEKTQCTIEREHGVFKKRFQALQTTMWEWETGKKNDNSILISLPTRLTCLRRLIHLNVDYDYLPSKLGVVVTTISSPNTISRLLTFTGSMLALSWLKTLGTVSSSQFTLHSPCTSLLWFAYFFVWRPSLQMVAHRTLEGLGTVYVCAKAI